MIALVMAVILPIVALQLYKIYVGHISFGAQMGFALAMAVFTGLGLYFAYRSSARNQS
ncbi:MAG TPA: hypothetical protein VJL88_11510 [Nitrospira sp.]|nr:hypothetical protein [Nitrospira sp.]